MRQDSSLPKQILWLLIWIVEAPFWCLDWILEYHSWKVLSWRRDQWIYPKYNIIWFERRLWTLMNLDSSHTFQGTHRFYHHCTYCHPHLMKKRSRSERWFGLVSFGKTSVWLQWKVYNLPVPAVQALHPAERLQLLLPTLTFRSVQASFLLLWYAIETRKKG